jgi:hypothetical protein
LAKTLTLFRGVVAPMQVRIVVRAIRDWLARCGYEQQTFARYIAKRRPAHDKRVKCFAFSHEREPNRGSHQFGPIQPHARRERQANVLTAVDSARYICCMLQAN